ncbi:hypothetical protein ACLOJK_040173 [Asimina triloba]
MEVDRPDSRSPNQLRPLACSRNLLHRAHGSARWSQGDTIVLAAVYGPKAGTRKNENPEKASIEVVWKPKTGQIGNSEKECEMILKRTLQSICLLTVHPNTTTSVILQVVNDDGALLPCAINAACAALVDAAIPLKHLAVAICCGLTESGSVILDPTKLEEQKIQAFVYLVFPNAALSIFPKPEHAEGEPMEHGIITSFTHGAMPAVILMACSDKMEVRWHMDLNKKVHVQEATFPESQGKLPLPDSWMTIYAALNEAVLQVQRSQNSSGEVYRHKYRDLMPEMQRPFQTLARDFHSSMVYKLVLVVDQKRNVSDTPKLLLEYVFGFNAKLGSSVAWGFEFDRLGRVRVLHMLAPGPKRGNAPVACYSRRQIFHGLGSLELDPSTIMLSCPGQDPTWNNGGRSVRLSGSFVWAVPSSREMSAEEVLHIAGGAFGGNRGVRPVPPEKGVFPLDHLHECDLIQAVHLVGLVADMALLKPAAVLPRSCSCLLWLFPRNTLSQAGLPHMRSVSGNLMARQDLSELGFLREVDEDASNEGNMKIGTEIDAGASNEGKMKIGDGHATPQGGKSVAN